MHRRGEIIMTAWELLDIIEDFWGDRISNSYYDSGDISATCLLYDAITFECSIKDAQFKGGVMLDSEHMVSTFFGKPLSTDSDIESIKSNLTMVDEYCRLRLPDKFLKKYEETCHDELHF
jgi:hypothetical protein